MNSVQLQQRLGYFGPFMQAWGVAPAQTHDAVYAESLLYQAHLVAPDVFVADVSHALGIPTPTQT